MSAVETVQMSGVVTDLLLRQHRCRLYAGEMGQMFATDPGPVSVAETKQMSTIAMGRCLVLILYTCPVEAANICAVSAEDTCLVLTVDVSCLNNLSCPDS